MKGIFTEAEHVRVWLDFGDASTERFFGHVLTSSDPVTVLNADRDSLAGLRAVLLCRWWKRLWVIQEAALASDVVIYSGPYSVPWNLLIEFFMRF